MGEKWHGRIQRRENQATLYNVMMSVAAGVAAHLAVQCTGDPRDADQVVERGEIRILGWARLGVGLRATQSSCSRGLLTIILSVA